MGGVIVSPGNPLVSNNICVQWGNGPQGSVSLAITGCGTVCADTTTVSIPIINSTGPITGDTVVCWGDNTIYCLPCWPGTWYHWTVQGGILVSDSNSCCITLHWTTGLPYGSYVITATWYDPLVGCSGSTSINVMVRPDFGVFGQTGPFCFGAISNFSASGPANSIVTGGTFPPTG